MLDPIPDTPENIARACMMSPPKKDWKLPQTRERGEESLISCLAKVVYNSHK